MHQPVLAGQNRDKGTEVDNACHFTRVDRTHLSLSGNRLNHLDGSVSCSRILTKDLYGAVIIDINRGTGFFCDLANRCTTLADNVADLVLIHLERRHAGCILRSDLTRRVQNRIHLSQNVQASFESLLERALHDFFVDPFDLDVHLQRSHALGRTRHLKVHVTKVILITQNVSQNSELVAVLHQAHGNPCHRGRQRYACCHHRERTHTNRCHRAGAIGLSNL